MRGTYVGRKLWAGLVCCGLCGAVQAQTNFWWTNTLAGVTNIWSTGGNWTNEAGGTGVPVSTNYSIINFTRPANTNISSNDLTGLTLNGLNFSNSTVTLVGQTLLFTNSSVALPRLNQFGASNVTISLALTLMTNTTFAGNGAGSLTVTKLIDGAGSLIKTGSHVLVLSASNAYYGPTIIDQGVLRVGHVRALGTNRTVIVNSGGTLDLNSIDLRTNYAYNVTISGAGAGGTGAVINAGATDLTNYGLSNLTLAADATIGGTKRWGIQYSLDLGGYRLTKVGANQVSVNGGTVTAGNIDINAGMISLEGNTIIVSNLPGSVVTINSGATLMLYGTGAGKITRPIVANGGTLQLGLGNAGGGTADSAVTMLANLTLNVGGNYTYNGAFAQSGGVYAITKAGSNTVIFTGSNTYSGGTIINLGNVAFANASALPATGPITINTGGALNVTGALTTVQGWLDSGRIVTNSGGALALMGVNVADMNFGTHPNLSLGATGVATNYGAITPAGNLYRLGGGGGTLVLPNNLALTGNRDVLINNLGFSGLVTLAGSNDHTGVTTLLNTFNGSTTLANITASSAFGSGSILFSNALANGANYISVNFNGGAGSLVITNPITMDSTMAGRLRFVSVTGSNIVTGPITLRTGGNNAGFEGSGLGTNGSWTILGDIDGTQLNGGGLYLAGTGVGAGGYVLGNVTLNGGVLMEKGGATRSEWSIGAPGKTYSWSYLRVNGILHLLTSGVLPSNSWLESTHNGDMIVDLNGTTQQVAYINTQTFTGNLITNYSTVPASLAIVGAVTNRSIFTGTVAENPGGGTISLLFSSGTMGLLGNNTYSGGTLLTNGALLVGSSTASFGTGLLELGADTGIGVTSLDQTFLNWVVANASGTPLVILLGGTNANNLSFSGALANTFLGAAGGTFPYGGIVTWDDNNLRLGGGSSNLLYVPTIGAGKNLVVGPVGGNPFSVVILTNAANSPDSTVIQSGTLQLGHSTTGLVVVGGGPIAISNAATLAFKFNSGTAIYTNFISGAGQISQLGTAPVFLVGSNAYSGGTLIAAAGRIGVGDDNALGTGPIIVTAAGFLSATGGVARVLANPLIVSNNFTLGNTTDTGLVTFVGPVDLGGTNRQLSTSSPIIMSGVIGNGGLTKAGSSILTLGATNTYTLGTLLSAGTLSIGSYSNLPNNAPVTFAGGTLQVTGTGLPNLTPYTINWTNFSGGLDVADAAHTLTVANTIVATGSFTKVGAGTLLLTGSNSFNAASYVNGGTLFLAPGSTNVFGNDFRLGNSAGTTGLVYQSGGVVTASLGNGLLLGGSGGTGYYTLTNGTLNALMTGNRGILIGVNNNSTGYFNFVGGVITGNQLQLSRTENVSATNTAGYFLQSGGTATFASLGVGGGNFSGGLTNAGNYGVLAVTSGVFTANALLGVAGGNNSTALFYFGTGAVVTLPGFGTVRGSNAYTEVTFDGGQLSPVSSTSTYMQNLSHTYFTSNGATFNVGSAITITVSQNIENATAQIGGLTKTGAGTLILAGTNTFGGGVVLQNGSLLFASSNALPASVGTLYIPYGAAAGMGYPIDQTFLTSISNASAGTVGLGADNANALDFSGLTNVSFGAVGGTWTNTADIVPYGTAYNLGGGNGTLVMANVLADQPGGATDLRAFGSGTGGILVLANTNTYTGATDLMGGGEVSISSYSNLPLTSLLFFNGGILQVTGVAVSNLNPYTVNWFSFDGGFDVASNGLVFTVANNLAGVGGLSKLGSGTLQLTGANSYKGPTVINGGVLQIGDGGTSGNLGTGVVTNNATLVFRRSDVYAVSNVIAGAGTIHLVGNGTLTAGTGFSLSPGLRLVLGEIAGTVGNLDLGATSQTIAALVVSNHNTSAFSTIAIGAGQSLTITNVFQVGAGTNVTGNTYTTKLAISGAGSLLVTNPGGTITFGNSNGNIKDVHNLTTVDLFNLGAFNVNLGTNGTFKLGSATTETGVASNLTTFATNTSITAGNITIHHQGASSGADTVRLGAGTNTLNANTITVGVGDIRNHNASLLFATNTGSVTIRAADGVGAANLTIGVRRAAGGCTNLVDFTGHYADLLLNTLDVGGAGYNAVSGGNVTGTFTFDTGTITATTLRIGSLLITATNSTATGNVNLGGGTVQIGSGAVTLATNTTTFTRARINGNLNISGGTVTIGTNAAGQSVLMTAGVGTNTANLNLTGGSVTLAGHISMGLAGGVNAATVTVAGATLDLTGHNLGTLAQPIAANFQSGTVFNLGELNGGAPLVKTGGGTLVLGGVNSYTGGTLVNAGILVASNAQALGSGAVAITNATLQLAQSLALGNTLTGNSGAYVDLGSAGTTLTINQSGTSTFAGSLTNAGALVKGGTGTLTLSGNSSYAGATVISNGTLALGVHDALPVGTALSAAAPGALDLAGYNQTVAGVQGYAGLVTNSGAASVFTMNVSGPTQTFSGTLAGNAGVVVRGGGVVNVTGQHQALGATTVTNATLLMNGTHTSGGLINVLDGGTLGGTGTLGQVTVYAGGIFKPGNGGPGLQMTGMLSLTGGLFHVSLVNSNAYSQAIVTNALSIAATTTNLLQLNLASYTFEGGATYLIVRDDSLLSYGASGNGCFTLLDPGGPQNQVLLANNLVFQAVGGASTANQFRINYDFDAQTGTFGSGNDILLTVIPEPGTASLLGLVGLVCLVRQLRRHLQARS